MYSKPITLGKAREELVAIPTDSDSMVPENMKNVRSGFEDQLLVSKKVSESITGDFKKISVIPDGNRGAILPDTNVQLWGRSFVVGLKGIGARISMYEDEKLGFQGVAFSREPIFSSESWFGENPWGAMSHQGCMEDLRITEIAEHNGINGFHICPMIKATPLPKWLMKEALSRFWYRRLDRPGPYYQQTRLMPSDVRLFYQSESTLGSKTTGVLKAFGISNQEDLDAFIDNYIRSGMAALTLIPRTMKQHDTWDYIGLDYVDVWLDKDSVIAPDGVLYFADIEGLDWVPLRDETEAALRIKRQFNRNFYEFMYGLDGLLRERQYLPGLITPRWELRQELAARMELALERDEFLRLERETDSIYISVLMKNKDLPEVKIKLLDLK